MNVSPRIWTPALRSLLCAFLMLLSAAPGYPAAPDTNLLAELFAPPKVRLRKVESIRVNPEPTDSAEETRIKGLVKNLANIESADFGFSPTMSGSAFAPLNSTERPGAFLITDHRLKRSEDFTELIKLGPKALSSLLKALDDQTPTKLVINHDFGFGGMWFDRELSGNPGNTSETRILAGVPKAKDHFAQMNNAFSLRTYTVRIGDICFVAIGQIVGRPYQAVRYQPTACIVINSASEDDQISQAVRAIWSSDNPPQALLNSLLLDFASEGVFNGRSLDGWDWGSSLQIGAAMRLLYYFPKQTADLVAARLHELDVGKNDMMREVTNRVRAVDFIKAVAWCKEPVVQRELQRIFRTTIDPEILREAVLSVDPSDAPEFRKRLEEFISKLPGTEPGPFGQGYHLLVTLAEQFGVEAKPAFARYMQDASLQRRRTMCRVLGKVQGQWSIEFLAPLLKDPRPADGWTYAVLPDQNEPRLPIRVCDEAAQTIAQNFPELHFEMAGEHADLDVQIKTMQRRIEAKDY